jgi:hypothetical protein
MSHTEEFRKLIIQGLPVAIILLYVLFPVSFARVSSHPLGKCIAVLMIVLYSYQDMMHGLIICLLIILYYQQDSEGFLSRQTQEYAEYLPKPSLKEHSIGFEGHAEKDFTPVEEAYPDTLPPVRKVSELLFRREFCHPTDGQVLHKNQPVYHSLVSHVYPELTFREGECNPCDRTCHFTIDRKQEAEGDLQPKSSRYASLREMAKYLVGSTEEPVVVFHDQVATKIID